MATRWSTTQKAAASPLATQEVAEGRRSLLARARSHARQNPTGVGGLIIVLVLVIVAALADVLATYDPNVIVGSVNQSSSSEYYLGTDIIGRDIFSRLVHGTRVSLAVGLGAVFMGVSLGSLLGLVSAYLGGYFDLLVQRLVDAKLAIPGIILALVLIAILGPGIFNVVIALSLGYLTIASRVVRSVALREKETVYVEAARAIGATSRRIIFKHIMPNTVAPYLVLISIYVGSAIVAESSLSFLGAGVGPDVPSWGSMLAVAARSYFDAAPMLAIAPGVAITAAVLGFNLLGDAIRDIHDPKMHKR